MIYYNIILIKVAFFVSFVIVNALNRLSIRLYPSICANINLINVLQLNIKLNYKKTLIMKEISISDILKISLVKIKTEKPIEVKAPAPIVVAEIVKPHTIREKKPKMLTNDTPTSNWISGHTRKSQNKWDGRILKLEAFFNSIDLPTHEIRLSQCEIITDVQKFITSHLEYVERYNGNMTFEPYLLRLEKLKNILSL